MLHIHLHNFVACTLARVLHLHVHLHAAVRIHVRRTRTHSLVVKRRVAQPVSKRIQRLFFAVQVRPSIQQVVVQNRQQLRVARWPCLRQTARGRVIAKQNIGQSVALLPGCYASCAQSREHSAGSRQWHTENSTAAPRSFSDSLQIPSSPALPAPAQSSCDPHPLFRSMAPGTDPILRCTPDDCRRRRLPRRPSSPAKPPLPDSSRPRTATFTFAPAASRMPSRIVTEYGHVPLYQSCSTWSIQGPITAIVFNFVLSSGSVFPSFFSSTIDSSVACRASALLESRSHGGISPPVSTPIFA